MKSMEESKQIAIGLRNDLENELGMQSVINKLLSPLRNNTDNLSATERLGYLTIAKLLLDYFIENENFNIEFNFNNSSVANKYAEVKNALENIVYGKI